MNKVIVLYVEPNGTVQPINCQFSHFFIGVDEAAVFNHPETIAVAIKEIKRDKGNWGPHISKNGKFRIVNVERNKYPLELISYSYGSGLAHKYKGNIWRVPLKSINNMSADAWYQKLKAQRRVGIA